MLKRFLILSIVGILVFQPCFAAGNINKITNFDVNVKYQSKQDYQFKKVNKKFDTVVLNIINNNSSAVLTNANTEIVYKVNGKTYNANRRVDVYKKTRKRDIGKHYGIAFPCSILAGGIIGITFGLGAPFAIGVGILGNMPAQKATAKNYEFAYDAYVSRGLPLRFEPKEVHQFRIFVQKGIRPQELILTNVSYESNKNKFYDLVLNCENK